MRAIVTGAGRGGTNLLTEMLRSSGLFNMDSLVVEDRLLFNKETLPENYATKLATENNGMSEDNLIKLMNKYPDLHLFFVFRHPVSHCMSKIIRGRPEKDGGDGGTELAKDATEEGSIEWVNRAFDIYYYLITLYPERVLAVRMEDLIEDYNKVVNAVFEYITKDKIIENKDDVLNNMNNAYKYNRNKYQRERYGTQLDKSQANIHNNWENAYDGYFKGERDFISRVQEECNYLLNFFMYDFV